MTFDLIKNKLDVLDCDAFELTETVTRGYEFYFIRHNLDQNRYTEIKSYTVNIYKKTKDDNGEYLGKASAELYPTYSEEDIDKVLSDLLFQATLIKNPVFSLNDKPLEEVSRINPSDLKDLSRAFIEMTNEVTETENKDMNSYEIFVKDIEKHFINSNDVEYIRNYPACVFEYVVNARKDGHEVELYRIGDYGSCKKAELKKEIEDTLQFAEDRLVALPTPKLTDIPVVLSTDVQVEIYNYFKEHMNAQYKVMNISDWELNKPICDAFEGDRVTLEAVKYLPDSSYNFDVDTEGAFINDRFLLKDGVPQAFYGSKQFSDYLGIENSSNVYNVIVTGGSKSVDELKQGDYLEIVEFSDFQVSAIGGDIAGEIRLGYLHKDGKTTIVTGGSVSGNMVDAAKKMEFSKEQTQYNNFKIPSITKLYGTTITGVAE